MSSPVLCPSCRAKMVRRSQCPRCGLLLLDDAGASPHWWDSLDRKQTFGLCVLAFVLYAMFWYQPPSNQTVDGMRAQRLQAEMEAQRRAEQLEILDAARAVALDRQKNPHLYPR